MSTRTETTFLTSDIHAEGWGDLDVWSQNDRGMLAYEQRGLFVLGDQGADGAEVLVAFEPDEAITAIHGGPLFAAFTASPRGCKVHLGDQQFVELDIPGPGYAPLLVEPTA